MNTLTKAFETLKSKSKYSHLTKTIKKHHLDKKRYPIVTHLKTLNTPITISFVTPNSTTNHKTS
jgi:hypothetical protein